MIQTVKQIISRIKDSPFCVIASFIVLGAISWPLAPIVLSSPIYYGIFFAAYTSLGFLLGAALSYVIEKHNEKINKDRIYKEIEDILISTNDEAYEPDDDLSSEIARYNMKYAFLHNYIPSHFEDAKLLLHPVYVKHFKPLAYGFLMLARHNRLTDENKQFILKKPEFAYELACGIVRLKNSLPIGKLQILLRAKKKSDINVMIKQLKALALHCYGLNENIWQKIEILLLNDIHRSPKCCMGDAISTLFRGWLTPHQEPLDILLTQNLTDTGEGIYGMAQLSLFHIDLAKKNKSRLFENPLLLPRIGRLIYYINLTRKGFKGDIFDIYMMNSTDCLDEDIFNKIMDNTNCLDELIEEFRSTQDSDQPVAQRVEKVLHQKYQKELAGVLAARNHKKEPIDKINKTLMGEIMCFFANPPTNAANSVLEEKKADHTCTSSTP